MQISGFQPLTLLDYPHHLAALIFTPGCPWRCGYCQNPEMVLPEKIKTRPLIPEATIFNHLKNRRKLLDGLAISGGEPTMQPDLITFIKKVKALGFLVKLDSSGVNPHILQQLISEKLVDYIAMDIKSSLEKYSTVIGVKVNPTSIQNSIQLIMNSGLDYEFRTTLLPRYHDEIELAKIGESIQGAKIWYGQQFRSQITLDPSFRTEPTLDKVNLDKLAKIMGKYVKQVKIRT